MTYTGLLYLYYYYTMAAKSLKRSWTDVEVVFLIDLYEGHPCLWNVYSKSYHKRELKEKSLAEISETLDVSMNEIKAKWNSLRAYYGKELAKVNGTKSGQGTNELYESSWVFMDNMKFLDNNNNKKKRQVV